MADVFISYASEDPRARGQTGQRTGRARLVGVVGSQDCRRPGFRSRDSSVNWKPPSVWLSYESIHSIESEWVKNEASVASERGVLVPALIDSVKLPLEFRRKQTADLIGWDGDLSHGGFHALCEGIAASMGIAAPPLTTSPKESKSNGKLSWLWPAIVGVVIVVGLFAFALRSWQTSPPRSQIDSSDTKQAVREPIERRHKKRPEQIGKLADLVIGNLSW